MRATRAAEDWAGRSGGRGHRYAFFFPFQNFLFFGFPLFSRGCAALPIFAPNLSGPDLQPSLISDFLKITAGGGRGAGPGRGGRARSAVPLGCSRLALRVALRRAPLSSAPRGPEGEVAPGLGGRGQGELPGAD